MTSPNFPKLPLPTLFRRLWVAEDLQGKKRVPYKVLASRYDVSVRTIKTDVAWIRQEMPLELVRKGVLGKVLKALDAIEDPETILKYGLPYLGKYVTQHIESKSDVTVKKEVSPIDVRKFSSEERDEITRVVRLLANAREMGEK